MTEIRRGFEVEAAETASVDTNKSYPLPSEQFAEGNNEIFFAPNDDTRGSRPMPLGDRLSISEGTGSVRPRASNSAADGLLPLPEDDGPDPSTSYRIHGDFDPQISDVERTMPGDLGRDDGTQSLAPEFETQSEDVCQRDGDPDAVIDHLIVAVKGPHTVSALRSLVHRLTPESTIIFLQNGMGIIEEVNNELFPSDEDRPHYMVGVNSHGLFGKGPFDIVHAGTGTMALGLMPLTPDKSVSMMKQSFPTSAKYLLRTMTRTPVFVAVGFNPTDLLQQQLDKLAVNAVINPLTAMLDCMNGQLLADFNTTRVMRLLLAEVSVVLRSLPELKNVPNVNMRFDTTRLEAMVVGIAKRTEHNRSSMLQDVMGGRQTEIDYLNGYIVKRGEELGIHCLTNYMIMQMVKSKQKLTELERGGHVPLQPSIRPKS